LKSLSLIDKSSTGLSLNPAVLRQVFNPFNQLVAQGNSLSRQGEDIVMVKEQERAELHRAIWQIANDLRGSVDGWDFKQVGNKIIEENVYNIAVSTYVAQKDTREVIDIQKLNAEIKGIVARQNELRNAIDEIVADLEGSR
jgi:hypothetical protein